MEILEEKKRAIDEQYQHVKNKIMYQRFSGKSPQDIRKEQIVGSFPSAFVLLQSRKAFRDHQNSNSRSKFLGKIKIYTTEGQKIIPCGCEKYGVSKCQIPGHNNNEITTSRRSIQIQFDDQVRHFTRSLKSLKSQKCIRKISRVIQTDNKKSTRPIGYNTQLKISEFQSERPRESYGFVIPSQLKQVRNNKKSNLQLKMKIPSNECSFCLKKCQSFICRSCLQFKVRK